MSLDHGWITVGARRWCLACGSYQTRQGGRWADAMLGPWPGYARTDPAAHRGDAPRGEWS